jgi:adenosylmethionine-8-amino-7-oxononanoate aminotransferase
MTVAKGLTSGYAPMGAVLMSDAVYQGIADGDPVASVGHGHTYSARPVSAAIGLEVVRLYHELVADKDSKQAFDASLKLPDRIAAAAYKNRLVFRAFGDNISGFAPALSYTAAEFDLLFERLERTLDNVLAEPEVRAALRAKDGVKGSIKGGVAA